MNTLNKFNQVFTNKHVILPVIHVESEGQALLNLIIAKDAGCDGVFLINHSMWHTELLQIHHKMYERFPNWWIGVNCLDVKTHDIFNKISNEVAGVWVDDAYVDERYEEQTDAEDIKNIRLKSGWEGLYFGGVAFKYRRTIEDFTRAASIAARYMDVVTTSGPGTGLAADRKKIKAMKIGTGNNPLAIASGITPENIDEYLDVADCFLVATGVSKNFTQLDSEKLKALVRKVRA